MSDLRDQILTAARTRFQHYGLQKTTMREIAADVGVAVGTLYRCFDGKDAIIAAFVDGFRGEHHRLSRDVLGSEAPAADKLLRYMTGRFHAARQTREEHPHAAEITRAVLRVVPERLEEERQLMAETTAAILAGGRQSGELHLPHPERDVEVFLLATAWFFPLATFEMPRWPRADELERVVRWFLERWSIPPNSV